MPIFLYEDNDIIVCHKPVGMATEGAGPGKMDLVSQVRNYLTRKSRQEGKKGPAYVGTVYRLDQPVEGVVVMGKNKITRPHEIDDSGRARMRSVFNPYKLVNSLG